MATKKANPPSALAVKKETSVSLLKSAVKNAELAFASVATAITEAKSPGVLADAYVTINREWVKVMDDLKGAARESLLTFATENGEADSEGQVLAVNVDFNGDTFKVQRCQYKAKSPTNGVFEAMLRKKGIPLEAGMNATLSHEYDAEKTAQLVAAGKLTQEEVESCRKLMAVQLKVEKV